MKHYKDANDKTYGFQEGQQIPDGLVEITKAEADRLGILNFEKQRQAEIADMDYVRQRITEYPLVSDFLDAWVKGDETAMEEYRKACLAVKAKYPKPAGF